MITTIKKELRKRLKVFYDKVIFRDFDGEKLFATLIDENGEKKEVYWRLEKDWETGRYILSSDWYYPIQND